MKAQARAQARVQVGSDDAALRDDARRRAKSEKLRSGTRIPCRLLICGLLFAVEFVRRELEEVALALDELEAVRGVDLEGLQQAEVAARMGVSRQTVGNLLARAHRKIADALLNGKALRVRTCADAPVLEREL